MYFAVEVKESVRPNLRFYFRTNFLAHELMTAFTYEQICITTIINAEVFQDFYSKLNRNTANPERSRSEQKNLRQQIICLINSGNFEDLAEGNFSRRMKFYIGFGTYEKPVAFQWIASIARNRFKIFRPSIALPRKCEGRKIRDYSV